MNITAQMYVYTLVLQNIFLIYNFKEHLNYYTLRSISGVNRFFGIHHFSHYRFIYTTTRLNFIYNCITIVYFSPCCLSIVNNCINIWYQTTFCTFPWPVFTPHTPHLMSYERCVHTPYVISCEWGVLIPHMISC